MVNIFEERRIDEFLNIIFNVKSTHEDETAQLKSVSHRDLCLSIEYWLDQLKSLFGEVTKISQLQGLGDEGVDVLLELIISSIKIGFQLKSHNDVKKKDFSRDLDAQITNSKKHGLDRYIISIASDLTHKSYGNKVRRKISEISQRNDPYIMQIPTEKLLTIYQAYCESIHPLDLLELNESSIFTILAKITNQLSKGDRKVKLDLKFEYSSEISKNGDQFELEFSPSAGSKNILTKIHYGTPSDIIRIEGSHIKKFRKNDQDYMKIPNWNLKYVEIKPELPSVQFDIALLSKSKNILKEYQKLTFYKRFENGNIYLTTNKTGFKFEFLLPRPTEEEYKISFNFQISLHEGSIDDLFESFDLWMNMTKAKYIEVETNISSFKREQLDLSGYKFPKLESIEIKFIKSLKLLTNLTGIKFENPYSKDLTYKEIYDTIDVADSIRRAYIPIKSKIDAKINKHFILSRLSERDEKSLIKGKFSLTQNVSAVVLGKKITLGPGTLLIQKFKVLNPELVEPTIQFENDFIDITLEIFDKNPRIKLKWFDKKKPTKTKKKKSTKGKRTKSVKHNKNKS